MTSDITSLSTHAAQYLPTWTAHIEAHCEPRRASPLLTWQSSLTHKYTYNLSRLRLPFSTAYWYSFYLYKNLKHSYNDILIINIKENHFQLRNISSSMRPPIVWQCSIYEINKLCRILWWWEALARRIYLRTKVQLFTGWKVKNDLHLWGWVSFTLFKFFYLLSVINFLRKIQLHMSKI